MQSALDKYQSGDSGELEALMQQGHLDRRSSIDLLADLDLDFGALADLGTAAASFGVGSMTGAGSLGTTGGGSHVAIAGGIGGVGSGGGGGGVSSGTGGINGATSGRAVAPSPSAATDAMIHQDDSMMHMMGFELDMPFGIAPVGSVGVSEDHIEEHAPRPQVHDPGVPAFHAMPPPPLPLNVKKGHTAIDDDDDDVEHDDEQDDDDDELDEHHRRLMLPPPPRLQGSSLMGGLSPAGGLGEDDTADGLAHVPPHMRYSPPATAAARAVDRSCPTAAVEGRVSSTVLTAPPTGHLAQGPVPPYEALINFPRAKSR